MPRSILLTQCLQNDFVAPLGRHASLPNALHIGPTEATRLLGRDPQAGPLAQLVHWARAEEDLEVVHIRDWHDPSDPAQSAHLGQFGTHCVRGTPGAELVVGLGKEDHPREHFVDSTTLNDFEGTGLLPLLERLGAQEDCRIGVIGVWTDAKVSFLLYDLLTRLGVTQLATCSALTASSSRSQHFNALEQLRRILGVEVFDSVGDFAEWLRPGSARITLPTLPSRSGARIEGATLDHEDHQLAAWLYRDAAVVELHALGGGFSGAKVFRARSFDALGHELAPTVLKLGPRDIVAKERAALERVEAILGNDSPTLRGGADLGGRGGLQYAYAGMGKHTRVRPFKDVYEDGASHDALVKLFETVFGDILGRFYKVARYERLDLFAHYTFSSRWADSVRRKIAALVGEAAAAHHAVYRFYAEDLDRYGWPARFYYVSYIHGDLNGANILVDGQENVWIIDFFHTARGHAVRDLIKIENDILFLMTQLNDDQALAEAFEISDMLADVSDLRAPLPSLPTHIRTPALIRAWKTITILREHVGRICREDRNPVHFSVGRLRYAVHTLGFDEASRRQKLWALHTAERLARDIVREASCGQELRLDRVQLPSRDSWLAMTVCPGRKDWARDLDRDLQSIVDSGAEVLISLLTEPELVWAGVADLKARAEQLGLTHHFAPIPDQQAPDPRLMSTIAGWFDDAKGPVVVHCLGGLGRSGLVAACMLGIEGEDGTRAIELVREARGPRAVESSRQEAFVHAWCEAHSAGS